MLGVVGLICAYVFIGLLLLNLNLYSNWNWRIKAAMICLVSFFYILTYLSFPPIMGWPTKDELPPEFRLISGYILEPDKRTGTDGQIFLWVTDLSKNPRATKPRSFSLPYSEKLSKKVAEASKKIEKGKAQIGEVQEIADGSYRNPQGLARIKPKSIAINFFDLPNPSVPSK